MDIINIPTTKRLENKMKFEVAIKLNQNKINKNNSTKFGELLYYSEFNSDHFYTIDCIHYRKNCVYASSTSSLFLLRPSLKYQD
jgi:hypothetical protein